MCRTFFKAPRKSAKTEKQPPSPPSRQSLILGFTLRPSSLFSFLLDNILKVYIIPWFEIKLEAHAEASC